MAETRDRLYATELQARPEYQEQVVKPWEAVQRTLENVCKRNGINLEDVWKACRMAKPEERDAVFAEMMVPMNPLDQQRFTQATDAIPRITAAQASLEANSKEKLAEFRRQDDERQARARDNNTGTALASQQQHRAVREKEFPMLYKMPGDTPEVKAYNAAIGDSYRVAEQIVRNGVERLSPEIQGMMAFDAVTADAINRNMGAVLESQVKLNQEKDTKIAELDAALKTAQSELDEYRGGVPGGGGMPPGGGGASAGPGGADEPLEARTGRYAASLGWVK